MCLSGPVSESAVGEAIIDSRNLDQLALSERDKTMIKQNLCYFVVFHVLLLTTAAVGQNCGDTSKNG